MFFFIVLVVFLFWYFFLRGPVKRPIIEPLGFRGINWGTDISTLKDMEYFATDPDCEEVKAYIRKGDDLRLGEANLTGIGYHFWKEKFYCVTIGMKGHINWIGLKRALFEEFGEDFIKTPFREEYVFWGKIIEIKLQYDETSEKGDLYMYSADLLTQLARRLKREQRQDSNMRERRIEE